MIIERDVTWYTEGDCWLLMKRLHRLTGWPCYSFAVTEDDCVEATTHGFVQRPDFLFLDVEGLWCRQEMLERYWSFHQDPNDIQEFPLAAFREMIGSRAEFPGSLARAIPIADELLDKYGAPWYGV